MFKMLNGYTTIDALDVEEGSMRQNSDSSRHSSASGKSYRTFAAEKIQQRLLTGEGLGTPYKSFSPSTFKERMAMNENKPVETKTKQTKIKKNILKSIMGQVPAVALGALLNLMWAVPFGVAYFPVEWRSIEQGPPPPGSEHGAFPLPGKDALGIRIFLFASAIGQLVFTFTSKFTNPMGMQMIENVPFCHSLAFICIAEQGYGVEALSTLFVIFGASSVIVGAFFFVLGWLKMGNVVYFIPNHVLLGCIGGIGIFIIQVAVEVTINTTFEFTPSGIVDAITNFNLLGVVILFELILRVIMRLTQDSDGNARYPLLPPIYFCAITPIFYLVLFTFRVPLDAAQDAGYFFPRLDSCNPEVDDSCSGDGSFFSSVFNEDLWDMWRIIDFTNISWTAVWKSIPTLIGLTAFSLIHVPINIPAFAVSTNVESDMNNELMSHGYSNALSGILGGLQNYMCYSNSVAYAKSGGEGRWSSLAVTILTFGLFFVGPVVASYVPRCMAGTLLVHLGLELFLEGVKDSFGNYDSLEYAGIWLIVFVMTYYGMSAALIAGAISAVTTYVVQSIASQNPVRGSMTATRLRSSKWNRHPRANVILDDKYIGRSKILVIQLQGHIFFGNITQMTESIRSLLEAKSDLKEDVWITIMDFTMVVGIDSSAAQAISKIKKMMHNEFNVPIAVYVTGSSDGFPCAFDLQQELAAAYQPGEEDKKPVIVAKSPRHTLTPTPKQRKALVLHRMRSMPSGYMDPKAKVPSDKVCESLDEALVFAEDVLIAREDRSLLDERVGSKIDYGCENDAFTVTEDTKLALQFLANLCPGERIEDVRYLLSMFKREVRYAGETVWKQGSHSDSAKLLVRGNVSTVPENEPGIHEKVPIGAMIGEVGLVNGTDRMNTVNCNAGFAVFFSLDEEAWGKLVEENPKVARFMDMIALRVLSHRVQQVSNKVLEVRTLPI